MAGLTTKAFVNAIIKKHGLDAKPLEIGKEWCLMMSDREKWLNLCATFGVSGWESRDGFIACNLREQPYKPQIRF